MDILHVLFIVAVLLALQYFTLVIYRSWKSEIKKEKALDKALFDVALAHPIEQVECFQRVYKEHGPIFYDDLVCILLEIAKQMKMHPNISRRLNPIHFHLFIYLNKWGKLSMKDRDKIFDGYKELLPMEEKDLLIDLLVENQSIREIDATFY